MIWIWLHQLLCNVSNQARGKSEDALNKPWRPLPSGRLTEPQAVVLRWITVAVCLLLSATYGRDLLMTTVGLILTTLLYDELGMASHHIGKNLCNIGGYTTIEVGATKLMGMSISLASCVIKPAHNLTSRCEPRLGLCIHRGRHHQWSPYIHYHSGTRLPRHRRRRGLGSCDFPHLCPRILAYIHVHCHAGMVDLSWVVLGHRCH